MSITIVSIYPALLGTYGVELIAREVALDVEQAVRAADRLGWPVTLKAATRDRLTRATASGGVRDIPEAAQLPATWGRKSDALGAVTLPAGGTSCEGAPSRGAFCVSTARRRLVRATRCGFLTSPGPGG